MPTQVRGNVDIKALTITNAEVAAGAGIVQSKLALVAPLSTFAALANAAGVLTNNGAGVLSWAAGGGGGPIAWADLPSGSGAWNGAPTIHGIVTIGSGYRLRSDVGVPLYLDGATAIYLNAISAASVVHVSSYLNIDPAVIGNALVAFGYGGTAHGSIGLAGAIKGTSAIDLAFYAGTLGAGMTWMVNASAADAMTLSSAGVLSANGAGLTNLNATNLATGTVPAGRMPALTGDVTSAAGTVATTLAAVNADVGTFGSASQTVTVTVNAKGLITAITQQAVTGGGGGTITGSGTAGTLPKWTGTTALGNSLVSESGTTVSVNGRLTTNNVLTASAADGVAANAYVCDIRNLEATAGESFGIFLQAGSGAGDTALFVRNVGMVDLLRLGGDGVLHSYKAGVILSAVAGGTAAIYSHTANSGGNVYLGLDSSSAGVFGLGAYAGVLATDSASGLSLNAAHASGALRLYAGGTLRFQAAANGDWYRGSSLMDSVGTPSIASGFGGGASIAGTDYAFVITVGPTASTGGTVTFGRTFASPPIVVVQLSFQDTCWVSSVTTTQAVISWLVGAAGAGIKVMVFVRGY